MTTFCLGVYGVNQSVVRTLLHPCPQVGIIIQGISGRETPGTSSESQIMCIYKTDIPGLNCGPVGTLLTAYCFVNITFLHNSMCKLYTDHSSSADESFPPPATRLKEKNTI